MASSASAATTVSHKNAAKVLRAARKLDQDQNDDQADEDEFAYVAKYTLKMISCDAGTSVPNENGEYDSYGAAIFRLCPSESGCSDDASRGCGAGYGDYVVPLQTFVDAYFEDQRDNMNWDDQFQVDQYAECKEYEMEQDDDANQNQNDQAQYFVGPTCTADGADIRLAVFSDEDCVYESETSFETISNGWSLPYSSGGLVSTSCIDCLAYNDDGEYELREMCQELYENAGYKCETEMEYYSYYGQNTQGCDNIAQLLPALSSGGNGGKVFGWIVFIMVVVGIGAYVVWWRKKKASAADGLMS